MRTIRRRGFVELCSSGAGAALVFSALPRSARAALAALERPVLPDYWREYLPAVAAQVNAHAAEAEVGFWFITDIHTPSNRFLSGAALAALAALTPVRKVLCGGDLPVAFTRPAFKSAAAALDYTVDAWKIGWLDPMEAAGLAVYPAKGNHDFTIRDDMETESGLTFSLTRTRDVFRSGASMRAAVTNEADPGAAYYYIDEPSSRTRYIVADTSDSVTSERTWWATVNGVNEAQLKWLAQTALTTIPEGWNAVVMHHIPITGCVGTEGERKTFALFRQMLEAYQNRGKVACPWGECDFTNAKGRILLDITGHHHAERQTFQRGILHATEPCDATYGDYIIGSKPWCGELPAKKRGTIYEHTFGCVQIAPKLDLAFFTRVGGGQNRVCHLKPLKLKVGETMSLKADRLAAVSDWGSYDADRITLRNNPANRWNKIVDYLDTVVKTAPDGTVTALKSGEAMIVARDRDLNKEIFPITVENG